MTTRTISNYADLDGISAFESTTTTSSLEIPHTSSFQPFQNATNAIDLDDTCAQIVVPTFFIVIIIVGFVGNLFVMLTVATNKKMRNTTNILIFNLALADMLFILICVPATGLLYVVTRWPLGLFMCRLGHYLIQVTVHASIDTLVLMSFDRYLAVVHPISSMTLRSTKNALIAVGVMWLLLSLLNSPLFMDYELVEIDEDLYCLNKKLLNGTYPKVFYGTFFFFGLVLPFVIIVVLYSIMVVRLLKIGKTMKGKKTAKVKRQSKDGLVVAGELKQKANSENMKSKRRVMKMVIVVVAIFVMCWTPIHVLFLLQFFVLEDVGNSFLCIKVFCNCLAYANSCVNPFLYAFLSESFRSNFKKLCSLFCFGRCGCLEEENKYVTEARTGKNCCEKTTVLASVIEMKPLKKQTAADKGGDTVEDESRADVKNENEIEKLVEKKF